MRILTVCGVLAAVLTAGCHKGEQPKKQPEASAPAQPAAPASPWTTGEFKDDMTDEVTHYIETKDGISSFQIACYPESNTFLFYSNTFQSNGQFGEIQYRLDDDKATTATALLTKSGAIMGAPVPFKQALKAGGDRFMNALSGLEFGTELLTQHHKRLRVRLRAFDGTATDLDFNIAGAEKEIAALNRTCQTALQGKGKAK